MNSTKTTIRVAVVEDREDERHHIAQLLRTSPGFACVAACASGEEALATLSPDCDVVLMDIQMGGMSGIECVKALKTQCPGTEIMMLTVVEDYERIFQALAAGATGYLLKTTSPPKLLEAIQELHAGGAPMSGQIARQVVGAFRDSRPAAPAGAGKLSPVEQAVLQWLAKGLLYKEVADKMRISPGTVRTHICHIYRKLHAHNRTEAILKGLPQRPDSRTGNFRSNLQDRK